MQASTITHQISWKQPAVVEYGNIQLDVRQPASAVRLAPGLSIGDIPAVFMDSIFPFSIYCLPLYIVTCRGGVTSCHARIL